MAEKRMFVVAFGNPFDGISLQGPFATPDEASEFAEDSDGDYWVIEVEKPEK